MNTVNTSTPLPMPTVPYKFKKNVYLLGCPVANLNLEDTVNEVDRIISTRIPHQHCVVNAGKLVLMERDPSLREIVKSCALINADGQSVVWALKLIGHRIPERVTGIDLMERLLLEAHLKKYRVFFLGAIQPVLDAVLELVRTKFPDLVIAGSRNGYFTNEDNNQIVTEIAASGADILFVAMGSPKKEYWMAQNLEKLNVPFCMGVGGSFDVLSGRSKRAPLWIQNVGMEWFFRFIQEPRRLWRRYLVDNFVFIYLVALQFFGLEAHIGKRSSKSLEKQEIT